MYFFSLAAQENSRKKMVVESYFEGQAVAAAYFKFRPKPPPSLLKRILDFLREEVSIKSCYKKSISTSLTNFNPIHVFNCFCIKWIVFTAEARTE